MGSDMLYVQKMIHQSNSNMTWSISHSELSGSVKHSVDQIKSSAQWVQSWLRRWYSGLVTCMICEYKKGLCVGRSQHVTPTPLV